MNYLFFEGIIIIFAFINFFFFCQNLSAKHEIFETDLETHRRTAQEIEEAGKKLVEEKNYHSDKIGQRLVQIKVSQLRQLCTI